MLVTLIQKNVYRVILGSNQEDIYYVSKGRTGSWKINHQGITIDFAKNRDDAINLAVTIQKGVTA
jgi:hypothetical protein